jgi:paraquat-inducible protein B
MSMKARDTVIGGFVIGAAVLAVGATILLGGGRLFQESHKFILFFDGSVTGLAVGAPVLTNGVKVGTVEGVTVELDLEKLSFRTAVLIEIDDNSIAIQGGRARIEEALKASGGDMGQAQRRLLGLLVDRGLRAQLRLQSFVTGQLAVEFTFRPGTPLRLVGGAPYPELPTLPSELERLQKTMQDFPFEEIVTDIRKIVQGINELIGSAELKKTSMALSKTAEDLGSIIDIWKRRSEGLADRLEKALDGVAAASARIDGKVDPLAAGAEETLRTARETMEQARKTMAIFEREMGSDSSAVGDLRTSLKAFVRAMDSLRALADYLEQHPEAILRGK